MNALYAIAAWTGFAFLFAAGGYATLRLVEFAVDRLEGFIASKFAEDALGHRADGDWPALPRDFTEPEHVDAFLLRSGEHQ